MAKSTKDKSTDGKTPAGSDKIPADEMQLLTPITNTETGSVAERASAEIALDNLLAVLPADKKSEIDIAELNSIFNDSNYQERLGLEPVDATIKPKTITSNTTVATTSIEDSSSKENTDVTPVTSVSTSDDADDDDDARTGASDTKYLRKINSKIGAYTRTILNPESNDARLEHTDTGLELIIIDLDTELTANAPQADKKDLTKSYRTATKARIQLEKRQKTYIAPASENDVLDAAGKYLNDTKYFTKLPEILTQKDLEGAIVKIVDYFKENTTTGLRGMRKRGQIVKALTPMLNNILSRTYASVNVNTLFTDRKDRRIATKLYKKELTYRNDLKINAKGGSD